MALSEEQKKAILDKIQTRKPASGGFSIRPKSEVANDFKISDKRINLDEFLNRSKERTRTALAEAKSLGNTALDFTLRPFLRGLTSIGITPFQAGTKIGGSEVKAEFTPKTKFDKLIYGDRPVRSIQQQAEPTRADIKELTGADIGGAGGLLLAGAGTLLDAVPGVGGSGKKVGQKLALDIAKDTNPKTIFTKLKGIFGATKADDELRVIANELKDVGDDKQVFERLSKEADSLQKPQAKPIPEKVEPSVLDDVADTPEGQELITASQAVPPLGAVSESPQALEGFSKAKNTIRESWTKLRETFEDSMIRLKELERTPGINLESGKLSPWETKQIMTSRIAARMQELKERADDMIANITTSAKDTGVDDISLRKEINEYLIAKHAPERNLRVGKPKAAGISTDEAATKLKEIESREYFPKIKEVADKMLEMDREVIDILKDNGLVSKKLYDELLTDYKFHVPLMREMDDKLSETISTISRQLDVQSSGIMKAVGSERKVEDILENIVMNYQRAINLSEKNKFAKSVFDFAENNKDKGIFKIMSDKPGINPDDARNFGVRIDGKQKWVQVQDPHLGAALKGINMDRMPGILSYVEVFTRMMSQLATRFNPDYFLSGFIRDTQEMLVSTGAAKDISAAGTLTKVPASLQTIIKSIRGVDDADTQLYKQFMKDGGGMGGMALSTKRDALKIDLSQQKKSSKKFAENVVSKIDDLSETFENANRFSVYKEALEKGLSRERAALLAQESTINFSRKGTGGPIINGLYMFANASIQGSTKMLRALKNPKVAAATLLSVGTAVELTGQWNDTIDPEWRTKIPEGTRSQNLIILLPSDTDDLNIIKIPVSWGIRPIKVTADTISDAAHSGDLDFTKALDRIGSAIIDGYNPLGGAGMRQALTPTALDIPGDIWANETFSGAPIKPDTYGREVPESERYFDSLQESLIGRGFIKGSQELADAVGIEISPADIMYAYQQIIGGTGRFASKVVNTVDSVSKGETPQSYDVPIAGRFYQTIDAERASATQEKQTDVKSYLKEQERDRLQTTRSAKGIVDEISRIKDPEAKAERLIKVYEENEAMGDKVMELLKEKQMGFTSEEKKIKQLGVENGRRAEYVVAQIKDIKDPQKKAEYLINLYEKKIVSDTVFDQIVFLLSE